MSWRKKEQIHWRQYFGPEGACGSRFTARDSCLVLWFHGIKQKLFNPKRLQVSGNYPNPTPLLSSTLGRITSPQGCAVDAVGEGSSISKNILNLNEVCIYPTMQHPVQRQTCVSQIHSRGFTNASRLTEANPPLPEPPAFQAPSQFTPVSTSTLRCHQRTDVKITQKNSSTVYKGWSYSSVH